MLAITLVLNCAMIFSSAFISRISGHSFFLFFSAKQEGKETLQQLFSEKNGSSSNS